MAPYGFSITKGVSWRGQQEEFSNVYHYDIVDEPGEDRAKSIVDTIVAAEKSVSGNQVTWLRARVYGPTNAGQAANRMLFVFDLTGPGDQTTGGNVPYELAAVVQCYVGRGPAGGKQFIRKYLHFCKHQNLAAGSDASLGNAALGASTRQAFADVMNGLKNVSHSASSFPICTPNGKHLPLLSSFETLPHLHTRQFRR